MAVIAGIAAAQTSALRVNGVEVPREQVLLALRAIAASAPGKRPDTSTALRMAVDQLVSRLLLLEAAREAKLSVDAKQVESSLAQRVAKMGGKQAFERFVAQTGISLTDFRRFEEEALLIKLFADKQLGPTTLVSDAEVKQYWDEHQEQFKHPDEYKVRVILARVPDGSSDATKEAARKRIDTALARLVAKEPFAQIALELSDDPGSRTKGGELGWVRKGMIPEKLEGAAFALEVGAFSAVVESEQGFHIFRLDEKRPAGVSPFAEVKEPLATMLKNMKLDQQMQLIIKQKLKTSMVEVLDPELESAMKQAPAASGTAAPEAVKPGAATVAPSPTPKS
jgi:parvulin-like peptidyl-prolyl isomerase